MANGKQDRRAVKEQKGERGKRRGESENERGSLKEGDKAHTKPKCELNLVY